MEAVMTDKADVLSLQKKVHELEFHVAEMKYKLTESECDRDVCDVMAMMMVIWMIYSYQNILEIYLPSISHWCDVVGDQAAARAFSGGATAASGERQEEGMVQISNRAA